MFFEFREASYLDLFLGQSRRTDLFAQALAGT